MIHKRAFILGGVIALVIILLVFGLTRSPTGAATKDDTPVVPFSEEEHNQVVETIEKAPMVSDIPEDETVAIIFYDYDTPSGEKRYRDTFRVTDEGVVSSGKSSVRVYLHSKYLPAFEEKGLCGALSEAVNNGDIGYKSDYGTARLLLKYREMLGYRDCVGL